MNCRITDMRSKEVVNICNGMKLGYVDDVEVDTRTATVVAIVVYGRPRFFGLLGREEDFVVPWGSIEIIGEDTILVRHDCPLPPRRKKMRFFENLFG